MNIEVHENDFVTAVWSNEGVALACPVGQPPSSLRAYRNNTKVIRQRSDSAESNRNNETEPNTKQQAGAAKTAVKKNPAGSEKHTKQQAGAAKTAVKKNPAGSEKHTKQQAGAAKTAVKKNPAGSEKHSARQHRKRQSGKEYKMGEPSEEGRRGLLYHK
jgi:hypothetical protein